MEKTIQTAKSKEPKIINFVHKNIIHRENILNERKYEGKNFKYDYTFVPHTLYPLADKPTLVTPQRPFTSKETITRQAKREYKINLDPISEAFVKERISKSIARATQTPKEKCEFPMTSAQEIGWYCKPLMDNTKWQRPLTSSHITQYVANYHKTMKINPFKIPPSSLKMK